MRLAREGPAAAPFSRRRVPCFSCPQEPAVFSSRTPRPHTGNRLTRAIAQLRAQGVDLIDLTESNPTLCGIRYDTEGIALALAGAAAAPYEPDPQGLAAARAEVARYYAERGMRVDPASLVLTSGTSEGYAHLFTLLAEPGDEVLVPTPGYPLLEVLTSIGGIGLIHYRQSYDDGAGWGVDIERLRGSVSTRTRAIVVVSPNNPTGAFLKTRELEQMGAICREHDLALIVDEVFSDYGVGSDPVRVTSAIGHVACLTFVLNGLSKVSGLPQMKLAWIHVSGPSELRAEAVDRLAFVADAYLSVGTPVQRAVSKLLLERHSAQRQIQERVIANDAALRTLLEGRAGCRVLRREGGWYGVLRLPDHLVDEDVAIALLEQEHVIAHPGYFYDFPAGAAFLVLSLLPEEDTFRDGILRMRNRLGSAEGPAGASATSTSG